MWNAFLLTFPYAQLPWQLFKYAILPFELTMLLAKFILVSRVPANADSDN